MKKKLFNILLVDDKPANLLALSELLSNNERNCLQAENGTDALRILLNENIDLIILDVQMPFMNGFEVAEIIKSNKRTKDIPIIFASAEKKEHKFMIQGYEEGAIDYLFKPLDSEITKAKVAVLLKLQKQKTDLVESKEALRKAHDELEQRVNERTAELLRVNTELNQTLKKLETTNKRLEEFSYVATHNLRAPMINLNGLVEIYTSNPHNNDVFEKIIHTTNFLNSTLNDLIGLLGLSKYITDNREVNIREIIDTLIKANEKKITDSHAEIKVEILYSYPFIYPYSHVENIVKIFLSNALAFRDEKRTLKVEIKLEKIDDFICISLTDNGIGIDLEKHGNKIFRPFQKLSSSSKGKGLGLYIAKTLIEGLGGKIMVSSQQQKGCTFTACLIDNPKF